MAEKYSFFNAVMDTDGNYDREYLAEDFAAYFASFIGNGIYANPSSSLKVTAAGGFNVSVAAGKAWINGYFYENTSAKTFSVDVENTNGQSRIDSIVLRLDLVNRRITTELKKGTVATSPTAPTLTRSTNIYELCLADIKVVGGNTEILQANITDRRYSSKCGVVSGVVDQIDTDGLFSQYNNEFYNFMDEVKDAFSKTEVGNLQNQIDIERARIDAITSLEEGSTTADAELVDIRAGADGVVYDSAGNAVRTQLENTLGSLRYDIFAELSETTTDKIMNLYAYNLNDNISAIQVSTTTEGYFACVQKVNEGDIVTINNDIPLSWRVEYNDKIIITDENHIVRKEIYYTEIHSANRMIKIAENGYLYISAKYNSNTMSEGDTILTISRLHTLKPLVLDADVLALYNRNSQYGDEALQAILHGRQIVIKTPNADGGNYTAVYSPVYMYQLPNFENEYLYLFYLRDEKQTLDLSALGMGQIQLPIYGELKMRLSQKYNQTPLK